MPNWTYTQIIVEGPEKDIAKFKEEASKNNVILEEGYYKGVEIWSLLDSLVPMPEEYKNTESGSNPVRVPPDIAKENRGAKDWYQWQNLYWGIKWGDCQTELQYEEPRALIFKTEFPWSYPHEAMIKISAKYPELIFELDMDEEGGFFWGDITYQNGIVIEDNIKEEASPRLYTEEEE